MTTGSSTRLFLTTLLTLVLAQLCLPAEGFVLSELQLDRSEAILERFDKAGCIALDLSGDWDYRLDEIKTGVTKIPNSFVGTCSPVEFVHRVFIPDSFRYYDWELLIPEYRYRADVSINDNLLLAGRGDFAGLRIPIRPEYLFYDEENEFSISVQNDLDRFSSVPLRAGLLQPEGYAGIFSGIYLVGRQNWTFAGCSYTYNNKPDSTGTNSTTTMRIKPHIMRNQSPPEDTLSATYDLANISVRAVLLDTQRTIVGQSSLTLADYYASSHSHPLMLPEFNPVFWTPENPLRYSLKLFLIHKKDTLSACDETVAFTDNTVTSAGFSDGIEIFQLKSVDYILQDADGLSPTSTLLLNDLRKTKEFGFNTVRIRGSLPSEGLLELADSLGIWIVADLGLNAVPSPFITEEYLNQVRSESVMQIIQASRNHPSLLAVCCASLLEFSDARIDSIVTILSKELKALTNLPVCIETPVLLPSTDNLDFIMLSRRPYDVSLARLDQQIQVPVVYSNIGTLSPISARTDSISASEHLSMIEYQIEQLLADERCIGYSVHSYADYIGGSPSIVQKGRRSDSRYPYGLVAANRMNKYATESVAELLETEAPIAPVKPPRNSVPNPIVFPAFALVAVLILSAIMRSNNVLRQNLRRVFRHSHGFFSDIRYRRYLPTSHTLLIWLMNSAALTGIVVSIAYWLRDSLRLDYFLTLVGLSPSVKLFVAKLLWSPGDAIAIVFALVLFCKLLHILYLKVLSNLFRPRVSLGQIWKYTNWAFAPLLFLLPLCAVMYRLLDFEFLVIPSLTTSGLVFLWCLVRLISALQNGFQSSSFRVSFLFILLTGVIFTGLYFSLDHWLHFPKYWHWLVSVYPQS